VVIKLSTTINNKDLVSSRITASTHMGLPFIFGIKLSTCSVKFHRQWGGGSLYAQCYTCMTTMINDLRQYTATLGFTAPLAVLYPLWYRIAVIGDDDAI